MGCGLETYGTDFVDKFPQREDVIKCDIDEEKLPFPSNYFDIVYSRHLFEHLTNLGFAMKETYRVLKEDGKLVLLTDNANCWAFAFGGTHLGKYEKIRAKTDKVIEDRHYMLFTDWHLQNHARKAGFKKIAVTYTLDNLTGIKGTVIEAVNMIFKNTLLKRVVYNTLKLEAVK
jgi:ubiquinone/menaquinone biosynthesis C-methylase UbiE